MPANKLPTPPGFGSLVPFDRNAHGGLGTPERGKAAFAAGLNSVMLVAAEMIPASRDYPVVFVRDTDSGQAYPAAVCGFGAGENRFIGDDGEWRVDTYVPSFVRCYPFFAMPVKDGADTLVCVDETALKPSDDPFFDSDGRPAPRWERYRKLIDELANARRQTLALCTKLDELELLETFEAHANVPGGKQLRLRGMSRVAEAKLNELPARELRGMMKQGLLSRVYAHLISLDNFRNLAGATQH